MLQQPAIPDNLLRQHTAIEELLDTPFALQAKSQRGHFAITNGRIQPCLNRPYALGQVQEHQTNQGDGEGDEWR